MTDKKGFPGFCQWRLVFTAVNQIDGEMPKCGMPYRDFGQHYPQHFVDTTNVEYYLRFAKHENRSVAILATEKVGDTCVTLPQAKIAEVLLDAVEKDVPIYICDCVKQQDSVLKVLYGGHGCISRVVDMRKVQQHSFRSLTN